jgi:hypothetical protein
MSLIMRGHSARQWLPTCAAATAAAAARPQIRLRAIHGAGLACPVEQTLHIVGVLPVVVASVLHRMRGYDEGSTSA